MAQILQIVRIRESPEMGFVSRQYIFGSRDTILGTVVVVNVRVAMVLMLPGVSRVLAGSVCNVCPFCDS